MGANQRRENVLVNPFLHGFADELLKLGAFPQHHRDLDPYDVGAAVADTMNQTQGLGAKSGLKAGPKITAPAAKKSAPTPLTTPNHMVDYSMKGQGE